MMLDFESACTGDVIGVDEAGRGPLAGGVFAAAVHVPLQSARALLDGAWSRVNDSKKLSPRIREGLAAEIKANSIWHIASASPAEIDEMNILNATHLAMRRAVEGVIARLGSSAEPFVLVDGLAVKNLPCESKNIVKGDSRSLLIAAASILAKTARDEDCMRLDALYPGYGFAAHKGYPVKAHIEAIGRLGLCPEHRKTFGPCRPHAGDSVD